MGATRRHHRACVCHESPPVPDPVIDTVPCCPSTCCVPTCRVPSSCMLPPNALHFDNFLSQPTCFFPPLQPPTPTPPPHPCSPQVTMASNYFGPLYLTLQLLDVLQASAPSRIVWVNSVGSQLVNPPYLGGNSWAPGEALMYMDVPRPRGTFGACMNFWVQAGWLDSIEVHSTTRQARDTQHLS